MKAWTDKLASFAPPLWLVTLVAAGMAAALLSIFVDTLHEHIRHGDELREAQRHPSRQPAFLAAANTATADPAQIKLR